jgi:pyrroloquinoline quinone biosynthesis protein D
MSDTTHAEIDSTLVPAIANGYRLQFETAQDNWVLLYPEGMVKLNPSAAEILKRCDGKTNIVDIIGALETAFETTGLTRDVHSFLTIAREQHWISFN